MRVFIDAIIYELQYRGGISRVFNETLPRLCELDSCLGLVVLFCQGRLRQAVPVHPRIQNQPVLALQRVLRPRRLWGNVPDRARQVAVNLAAGLGGGSIWHSTYYTRPLRWKGCRVVTVYDMIYERFQELFKNGAADELRECKRRCVAEADVVIVASEATARDLTQWYRLGERDIRVIPLGYSPVFRVLEEDSDTAPAHGRPFLLYIGRRAVYKNFQTLLSVYSRWAMRREFDLVVVGSHWSDSEQEKLTELQIRDKVQLLLDPNDETLCRFLNKAAAFVSPSVYEGFGLPLLEAMACGCPIVASRIPSTLEVAGDAAFYFDLAQPESFLEALSNVVAEGRDSRRVRMGLERVRAYSWERTARGVLHIYRSLVA